MNRKVLFTPNEIEQFFENFNNEVFSFDTETTSLVYSEIKLEGISFCDGENNAYIVLQGRDSKGNILFKNEFKKSIIDYLRGIFKKAKILIGHNIVYDLKVMHKYGIPFEHCELYCTMIADHLLDETRPHGLKDLAKQFLGVEITEYSNATFTSKFFEYAMNDALWTWQLCTLQKPLLQEQGLLKLFRDIEMPFQKVLVDMAVNGITVDKERVEKTTKEVKQKVEDLTVQMLEHIKEPYSMQVTLTGDSNVISKINFNSPAQLSDLLFTRLGLDVVERTPSGQPSVGRKTIAIYKKHPFVELLNKYKIASKLLHAFFEPMLDFVEADGKVRPSFKDTGTVTGRLSCSKPNLQQLPKVNKDMPIDTRQCFVADKGYKMVTCDFSGQELRVLTQITQEPVLIDTFNSGKDMHLATANDFFDLGIPEECLYTYNDKFDMYKDKFKNERDKAKCFHPDTEVLTRLGWKKITDIDTETYIVQATPKNGECILNWEKPTEVFTQYHSDKKLISLNNESTSLMVTPDHRMLAFRTNGRHYDTVPKEFNKARYWCNAGTLTALPTITTKNMTSLNELLLAVATQADGSFCNKDNIRFGFTKRRKIERMLLLLAPFPKEEYTVSKSSQGVTTFYIKKTLGKAIKRHLTNKKTFNWNILQLSTPIRHMILHECKLWDACAKFKSGKMFRYDTTIEDNADFVQALAVTLNCKATKIFNGSLWNVSIKYRPTTRGENLKIKEVEFTDKVACLSVPSTYVLVRYNGKTTITGQTVNFGMAYGKGAYGFSQDFGISEEEAQKILDKYFAALPAVKKAIEECHNQVRKTGYVTSLTGRRRRFNAKEFNGNKFYPNSAFRQSFNFLIQGFSADMIRIAMTKVREMAKNYPQWGLKTIFTVHDEAGYLIKENYVNEASEKIKETFENAVNFCIPVIADIGIGDDYSESK